jgi:hypothetical protein
MGGPVRIWSSCMLTVGLFAALGGCGGSAEQPSRAPVPAGTGFGLQPQEASAQPANVLTTLPDLPRAGEALAESTKATSPPPVLVRPGTAEKSALAFPVPAVPHPPPPRSPLWQPLSAAVGDTALAIEGVRCHEPEEALVFVERGTVAAIGADGQVTLTLTDRFDAGFDRRRSGTSAAERWCIPRLRVCWEHAAFADWNGTDRRGGTRIFPARSVSRDGANVMPRLVEYAARTSCRIRP